VTATVADAQVASSINVRGNTRVEAATILAYMTIKTGQSYSAADVDASVKALYDTGLFSDVSIVPGGGGLLVIVAENPIVNSVRFEGNNKVNSTILNSIISLSARGVLTNAKLQSDVARIEEYYGTQGRAAAEVTARIESLPDNRANVIFVVGENDRTGVASITFVGNDAFSAQRLRGVIQTRQTNWLSWLNKRDIYSEDRVAADEAALRRFYLARGYADFQVLATDADFDAAAGEYHLTFTVDEGPLYKFGVIAVDSSIPGVDPNVLQAIVSTRSGTTFDAGDVEKSVEDLTIELSRQGYVFAQVRPRGDRDYTSNIIAITYVIDEGPRAYIERIEIRGNTKTRDFVIRREFAISEGDAYNRVLIDRAERRLRATGFFSNVTISPVQGSAPDRVILIVAVEDQSTGSLSVAAGVSSTQGFIAEVSLEETNFLGRGQAIRFSLGGGKDEQTYNVSFTDPYFLGYRVSAGFDAYRQVSSSTSNRPYSSETTGGGVRIGLPLTDNLNATLNYKIDNKVTSGAAACDPLGTGTVTQCYFPDGSRLTSSVGYSLVYSTLDNRLDPRQGVWARFSQDFAGVGGDAQFVRTIADARWYRPISERADIVGFVRLGGGNVTGLGQPVAVADNFFRSDVRGFAPLGYGPRDTTGTASDAGLALGGRNFTIATAEVQFPFPLLPPDFGLRGAVFADAGMLWGVDTASCAMATCAGNATISDTTIRASAGASIMWASPFGLLRVDFAHAFAKADYDETQVVRFGAGTTF
jgi:outer membrane protein insertion porin family